MSITLESNDVAVLQIYLQDRAYADAYRYLRDLVNSQIPGEADFARSQELTALSSWFDAAAHINGDDGSFISEYVRGVTESVTASEGFPITDEQFQESSNTLAEQVLRDAIEKGELDSAQQYVDRDIQNAVETLHLPEWGWAGAMSDFLAPPLGLGKELASIPFDKIYDAIDAALDGMNRAYDRLVGDGLAQTFNDILDQLGRGFLNTILPRGMRPMDRGTNISFTAARTWRNYSPMVLDLDGDGIETLGANNSDAILFDHDGDGIKTGTGWVKADDALLVLDRNGNGLIDNGSELFGVDTVLANGHRAADGYVAMRELDTNGDGVLNGSDARYADLKTWRDLNQDGISQANELQSLTNAGIASLDLNGTPEAEHLLPGWNWQIISSTYTRTDGSTATLADINFADNGFYREFPDTLDTSAVRDLPAMAGSGLVRDLQEAATLSGSLQDQLRTLKDQGYVDRQTYLDQIKAIIDAWADTSRMDTADERTGLTTEEIRLLGSGTATSTGLHYIEAVGNSIGDTQGYTIDILYQPDGIEGDLIKLEAGHMGVGSDYTRINALSDAQKAEQIAQWREIGKVSRGDTPCNGEWRRVA